MICTKQIGKADINTQQIIDLLTAMEDGNHNESDRQIKAIKILYPDDHIRNRELDPKGFMDFISGLEMNDKRFELFELLKIILNSLAPLRSPITRVRELVVALLSWFTLFDTSNTVAYCNELITGCKKNTDNSFKIDLDVLAQTIKKHITNYGNSYKVLVNEAFKLKSIDAKHMEAILKNFFMANYEKCSGLKKVCLSFYPEYEVALKDLFNDVELVDSYIGLWNHCLRKVQKHAKIDERVRLFYRIVKPIFEIEQRSTATALLFIALLHMNRTELNVDQVKIWSTALRLMENQVQPGMNDKELRPIATEIERYWNENKVIKK